MSGSIPAVAPSKGMGRTPNAHARPRCLVTAPFTERALVRLAERCEVIYEDWRSTGKMYFGDELTERLNKDHVEIVIVEADQITAENIGGSTLRFIGACRGNPYQIDIAAATERHIPVVYAPGRNSQAVSELTIGITLALMRKTISAQRLLAKGVEYEKTGDFQRMYNSLQGDEISGKTVGIVGLGDIGSRVARIYISFGARILVYDPYIPEDKIAAVPAKKTTLEQLLSESDIVSVHVKLTDETYHLIEEKELSKMKPSAVLVNTSAPGTVDDVALLRALTEHRIAGAALDCQENEPVDSSNPFLPLENAVVTPHIGGDTEGTIERQSQMITDDLFRFLEGGRPVHLMNPEIYAEKK